MRICQSFTRLQGDPDLTCKDLQRYGRATEQMAGQLDRDVRQRAIEQVSCMYETQRPHVIATGLLESDEDVRRTIVCIPYSVRLSLLLAGFRDTAKEDAANRSSRFVFGCICG